MMKESRVIARRSDAGFTMLEVLTAALVLGIGLVGIMAMQTTAGIANRRAYDARAAMELAETTLERLKRDGYQWTGDPSLVSTSSWLGNGLSSVNIGRWTLPPNATGSVAQPMLNDMGIRGATIGPVPSGRENFREKNSRYCVQYRMDWVIPDQLARAEVRVFWANTRAGERAFAGTCAVLGTGTIREVDLPQFFEWVVVSGMIRWNQVGAQREIPING